MTMMRVDTQRQGEQGGGYHNDHAFTTLMTTMMEGMLIGIGCSSDTGLVAILLQSTATATIEAIAYIINK
jgi:hypothetical protein